MARCKYCGALIVWIDTPNGKHMPCDSDLVAYKRSDHAKGRVVTKNGEVLAARVGVNIGIADGIGYEPHWTHCKGARQQLEL